MPRTLSLRTDRFSGNCEDCVYPIVREDTEARGNYIWAPCPECGNQKKLARLYGQYKDHNCDARCQFASSPLCSCACGGANHMRGYIPLEANGEITADLLSKYRRTVANRQAGAQKRAAGRAAKAAAALEQAKVERLAAIGNSFIREILSDDFDVNATDLFDDYGKSVLNDIRVRWQQYAFCTSRQVEFLLRLAAQHEERKAREAQRDAEVKVPAPVGSGRQVVQGVVISRKEKYDDYSGGTYHRLTIKVQEDGGVWFVNVREPAAIRTDRGDIVRGVVTLEASSGDASFAFGKRPSKFEVIGQQEDFYDAGESALD